MSQPRVAIISRPSSNRSSCVRRLTFRKNGGRSCFSIRFTARIFHSTCQVSILHFRRERKNERLGKQETLARFFGVGGTAILVASLARQQLCAADLCVSQRR